MDDLFVIEQITSANASKFLGLTYSYLASKLSQIEINDRLHAFGVSFFDTPIGLIYAVIRPDESVGKIESWYVAEEYRRRGVGERLLATLEQVLKDHHCRNLELKYVKPAKATEDSPIEALLKKTRWDAPVPRSVIFRCRNEHIKHARWLEIAAAFPSFHVFPWRDLTDEDYQRLQQEQAQSSWYPEDLSPLISDELGFEIDPDVSIGLRSQGKLIGWMITRRLPQKTLLFYRTFICEEFQQTGKGIILYAESIKRMLGAGYTQGMFSIYADKTELLRFLQKMLGAYISETKIEYSVSKQI